jgi:calreticulin
MNKLTFISSLLLSAISGKVYFEETFTGSKIPKKWVQSEAKEDYGEFKIGAGEYFGDEKVSNGLQTTQDARFYSISAEFDSPLDSTKKDLVVQFSAKFEKSIECGGGYVKVNIIRLPLVLLYNTYILLF